MKYTFLLILVFVCNSLQADTFILNENTSKVYEHIFSFNLKTAKKLCAESIDKDNLAFPFLSLTADFLSLSNSPDDLSINNHLADVKTFLIKLDNLKSNKYKNFVKGELYFRMGLLKMYEGDYLSGGNSLRKSNKFLEENKKAYPNFLLNNKTLGLLKVMVGAIPKKFKFVENLAGIEGDIDKGLSLLSKVSYTETIEEHLYIQKEARLLYSLVLYSIKKNPKFSFNIVKLECREYKTNIFQNYIYALNAMIQGKNNLLLHILANKPTNNEEDIIYMDYMYGIAKMRKMDFSCIEVLRSFVIKSNNKTNKYDAYKSLYWMSTLKHDDANAKIYKTMAKLMNPKKMANDYDFKEAYLFHNLLKCRFYQDGGYNEEAKEQLKLKNRNSNYLLEAQYRKARILQNEKMLDEAIIAFLKVIETGKGSPRYFVRNAALELGSIYKEKGNKALAEKYLNMALNDFEKSTEHEKGIKQRAKGLLYSLEEE